MLGATTFAFSLIRKYFVIFGTLFNEIHIPRYKNDGTLDQLIDVPILVGDFEKTLARVFADPTAGRISAITLPRMSFQLVNIEYDQTRKLNPIENFTVQDPNNPNNYEQQFTPVPYNFNFRLWVYAAMFEDGTKIIEQILPFFTPEFTVSAELIPQMNITMNIPVVLQKMTSVEDNFAEGNFSDRRAIIWTLDFLLKGYLYGPIHDIGLIKFIDVNSWVPYPNTLPSQLSTNNAGLMETITIQPGLLPNGQSTTNAAASIPYKEITLGEDWGVCIIQTDYTGANT
jgi:hypothetical protein